jgi:alkylated DNA nucleotide flippase Atl1
MSDKNLSELLEELREELGKQRVMDEKGRQLLRNLDTDIQKLLLRSEGIEPDETFLEGLKDAIDHFEDSHPRLTSALSHMLTILSNAGI